MTIQMAMNIHLEDILQAPLPLEQTVVALEEKLLATFPSILFILIWRKVQEVDVVLAEVPTWLRIILLIFLSVVVVR